MDIFCVKISSKLSFIILYLKAAVCFVWREVSQTQILPFHQPQPSPDLSVCDHFCHICRLSQKTEKWLLTRYNQRSVDIKLNIKKFLAPTGVLEVQISVLLSSLNLIFLAYQSMLELEIEDLIEHARIC